MITSIVILLSTLVMSAVIGIYTIPRIVRLSRELHLYDLPDSRKVHTIPVPRLGGVAFLPTVIISIAAVVSVASRFGITFNPLSEAGAPQHFVAYLAGAMMLYCLGI